MTPLKAVDDDLCSSILAQFEKLGLADAIVPDDLSTTDDGSEDDDQKNRD